MSDEQFERLWQRVRQIEICVAILIAVLGLACWELWGIWQAVKC